MHSPARPKIALMKLAAIGDVALASRALNTFAQNYRPQFDFHWIIDSALKDLAEKLCANSGLNISFHPVDTKKLFNGSALQKFEVALHMAKIVFSLQPKYLLLLHRDVRYYALFRSVFLGKIFQIDRATRRELEIYTEAFDELAIQANLARQNHTSLDSQETARSNRIGILVGGAQNQKVSFHEKRWPHFNVLLKKIFSETNLEIHLFGSPDDISTADSFLKELGPSSRIKNHVGKLQLSELPDHLSKLDVFISIDSGLAHIAATTMTASHQNIFSLFGPTDPRIWQPQPSGDAKVHLFYKAKACSPCYKNDGLFQPCKFEENYFQHCMKDITADEVFKTLKSL